MDKRPIAIIDSGLGGLAVARAIWQRLPQQALIYLADHAFFPYGNKSEAVINRRLRKIVDWLVARDCRVVVIACNTITAAAIDKLRANYRLPFVGTEPAVKQGGIVLVTPTTAGSKRYRELIKNFPVTTLACPGLAEAVEAGRGIRKLLPKIPLQTERVILGCTHYILIKDLIQKTVGAKVRVIDPSRAIARQTEKVLGTPGKGKRQFFTTGQAGAVSRRATNLLGQSIIFSKCSL